MSDPSGYYFTTTIIVSAVTSTAAVMVFGILSEWRERRKAAQARFAAAQAQARAYVEARAARLNATSELAVFKSGSAVEAVAELAHDQWVEWTSALVASASGSERRALRRRLSDWESTWIPYAQLPESSREADRRRARAVLAALDAARKRPAPPPGATGGAA